MYYELHVAHYLCVFYFSKYSIPQCKCDYSQFTNKDIKVESAWLGSKFKASLAGILLRLT